MPPLGVAILVLPPAVVLCVELPERVDEVPIRVKLWRLADCPPAPFGNDLLDAAGNPFQRRLVLLDLRYTIVSHDVGAETSKLHLGSMVEVDAAYVWPEQDTRPCCWLGSVDQLAPPRLHDEDVRGRLIRKRNEREG